jgi:class 3 adenylate cyclase
MAATLLELSDFLAQVDLLHLQDRLTAEDIDMTVLPLLDDGDLKELGLSLGQRRKLLKGLRTQNANAGPSATAPDLPGTNPVQLRRLSVLFCDMVGSTELGERLDIDEMQIVLQHYYTLAETVARRHNGHLATSQGDGLVILFGYPKVLDGFAERCVLAARDLQTTLAETPVTIEGHDPIKIVTRIGIASGQAAVGLKHSDGAGDQMHLVGPVVNRAARLQTVAQPQSCAVDFKTRDLTQTSVHYTDAERHVLKGMSEPVEVYHLVGLRNITQTPLKPAQFVGRATEIEALVHAWESVKTGQARTVTVSGDAGLGKSTLVQSFLADAVTAPARVLHLQCGAMSAQSPLQPVANALSQLTASKDAAPSLASVLTAPTTEMADQVAEFLDLGEVSEGTTAISKNDRDAVLELLSGWIVGDGKTPGVVVLENAQWADVSTRALMAQAAETALADNAPLLMIAVTRDYANDIWQDDAAHRQIALPPLSRADATGLLNRIFAGAPIPDAVRDNILYHADGNPLMLNTLAQAQARQELPEVADAVVVPHTIYETVSKRLDNIQSGRGLIEALAVLGSHVPLDVLTGLYPLDARRMEPTLDALETGGLIEKRDLHGTETIGIRHKTYRDVIYEQIDGRVRRRLHASAFRVLHDLLDIRPELLAKHAQAAHDWENTAEFALSAGDAFLKRSALVEAGHYFEMADNALARLAPSAKVNAQRLRAVTGLASVERSRSGIATDRSAELGQMAVELARAIGDRKAELQAINGLYSHSLVRANYPKAEQYAKALLEAAELAQNETFVMIGTRAIGAVALHTGDQTTATQRLEEALGQYDQEAHLSFAHAQGYDHAEINAALLSMSLWISGDLDRARQIGAFSIDHSRKIDHAHSLAQAVSFRVMWGALARHGPELAEIAAEGLVVAEKHGISVMRAAARLFPFASALCRQPQPPSSAEMADLEQRVAEFRAANPFNYGPLLATVLAEIYLRAGDIEAADDLLAEGANTEKRTGETWTSSELIRMQARVAAMRGDADTADRLRRDALARAESTDATTILLRITCDIAENDRSRETLQAVQDTLSRMISLDDGWDITRARGLLDGKGAA